MKEEDTDHSNAVRFVSDHRLASSADPSEAVAYLLSLFSKVRESERKACIRLCEAEADAESPGSHAFHRACLRCAELIRRRGRRMTMTANLWLADEEARESYARFLREEIGRIDNGGAHPPWMSRQEAVSALEFELSRLDEEA